MYNIVLTPKVLLHSLAEQKVPNQSIVGLPEGFRRYGADAFGADFPMAGDGHGCRMA
jgi:hypothetical protein